MSNSRRGAGFWLRAWLPVALGVGVIVAGVDDAVQRTTRPLGRCAPSTRRFWAGEQSRLGARSISTFASAGHFLGYGLLALAWLRAWWMTLPRSVFLTDALLALLGTAMTASADELHQALLPGRTGTLRGMC